jgi:putative membrane protein
MNWNFEPSILLGMALLVGGYGAAIGPLRKNFPDARPVSNGRVLSFFTGVCFIFIALVSPIDFIGDHFLFSVHMTQHLLLTLVAPPLLLLGTPAWLARPWLAQPLVTRLARFVTRAAPALLLFNFVFVAYHIPAVYDLSLQNELIHIAIHVLLIITATITWMPILSPLPELPRLSYPLQILYLFVAAIPPTILAALITFATDILYPTYRAAPRIFGIPALEDQQIAGVVMWIPGTGVYLLALTIVFFKWFGGEQTAEYETNPNSQVPNQNS